MEKQIRSIQKFGSRGAYNNNKKMPQEVTPSPHSKKKWLFELSEIDEMIFFEQDEDLNLLLSCSESDEPSFFKCLTSSNPNYSPPQMEGTSDGTDTNTIDEGCASTII